MLQCRSEGFLPSRGHIIKVIGYVRVSTKKQVSQGQGLDAQRAAIAKWAKVGKHQIVAWHSDDGLSGGLSIAARPGLTAALVAAKAAGVDALVVDRLDRLARDLIAQETVVDSLRSAGRDLHSVDPGEDQNLRLEGDERGTRTMLRQILGAISQQQKAELKHKLTTGRATKAAKGGFAYGSPPFGWRTSGKLAGQPPELVPDAAEQDVLRVMLDLKDSGLSLRGIAAALNEQDRKSKRGGKWLPTTVARALQGATRASNPIPGT